MVHAVEHEVEALAPSALWFVMENPAMHRVLDQGPDQEPADEQACNRTQRLSARPSREVEHISHEGQINEVRCRRMHMRKKLHEVALKHSDRFVFVRDVMLRHW